MRSKQSALPIVFVLVVLAISAPLLAGTLSREESVFPRVASNQSRAIVLVPFPLTQTPVEKTDDAPLMTMSNYCNSAILTYSCPNGFGECVPDEACYDGNPYTPCMAACAFTEFGCVDCPTW